MRRVLKGTVIGLVPGGMMILLATVFSRSEWTLAVGVGGIYIAVIGAIVGGLIAYQRRRL